MSVTSGFFNSLDGDRVYDAQQLCSIFDGVFSDGILRYFGDNFKVSPEKMGITVGTGKAWFNNTWTINDGTEYFDIEASSSSNNRIDTVILEINKKISDRSNSIKIKVGEPATSPKAPELETGDIFLEVPLANIYIPAGATSILDSNITMLVGTEDCPFAKGILETDEILETFQNRFDKWFEDLNVTLQEDVAANLNRKLNNLGERIDLVKEITDFTFSKGYEQYSDNQVPTLHVNGKLVTLSGAIKNTKSLSASYDNNVMATIPEEYCPSQDLRFVSQGSQLNRFLLTITTEGKICWARYGTTTSVAPANSTWFNLTGTWVIK
jgi:hypothetical protein